MVLKQMMKNTSWDFGGSLLRLPGQCAQASGFSPRYQSDTDVELDL